MKNRLGRPGAVALSVVLAASCGQQPNKTEPAANESDLEEVANLAEPAGNAAEVEQERQSRSILRPDIAAPTPEPPSVEPVHAVISFGASSFALDEAGRAAIDALLDAPAMKSGGAIILRGHSDSRGSDGDNQAASRVRAERVRAYLVEKGIAPERITLIALGETRPAAPNAMADGQDDPEGRAKNRRVEIDVAADNAVANESADPIAVN